MDIIKKGFGKALKEYRKINNITQEKLAEKIGINLRQLARIEAGESFITSYTLYNICVALNIGPNQLFNFKIENETLKTGTDNKVYFSAIKSGNIVQLVNENVGESKNSNAKKQLKEIDLKMQITAKRLNKEIIVDEITDGHVVITKTYMPNGKIKIEEKSEPNKQLDLLREKINEIADDKSKIEFVSLAIDALSSKDSFNELKSLMQGMDLIYKYS